MCSDVNYKSLEIAIRISNISELDIEIYAKNLCMVINGPDEFVSKKKFLKLRKVSIFLHVKLFIIFW